MVAEYLTATLYFAICVLLILAGSFASLASGWPGDKEPLNLWPLIFGILIALGKGVAATLIGARNRLGLVAVVLTSIAGAALVISELPLVALVEVLLVVLAFFCWGFLAPEAVSSNGPEPQRSRRGRQADPDSR